jgi:hypothetical protein
MARHNPSRRPFSSTERGRGPTDPAEPGHRKGGHHRNRSDHRGWVKRALAVEAGLEFGLVCGLILDGPRHHMLGYLINWITNTEDYSHGNGPQRIQSIRGITEWTR